MRKIAVCMLFLTSLTSGQSIIFHSEQIRIDILTHSCRLTGNYTFRNDSDRAIRQMLSYPFPVQDKLPYPDFISITDENGENIPFTKQKKSIQFPVTLKAKSSRIYNIVYEQSTPGKFFEYILETTKNWYFPLASAEFSIFAPDTIIIQDISPPGFKIIGNGSETRYRLYRENFRSDKNLSIQWRIK